ncbi:glutamate--cysteine ligase [bacterium]|nr:glutamate--cysteine ligase [bacterium]
MLTSISKEIEDNQERVLTWITSLEEQVDLPLYTSVDVRDAGFKASVIDTNLFPAGFNNLSAIERARASTLMNQAINDRVNGCKNVLILCEEHTRNTWYLENVRILQEIVQNAGFAAIVSTFFTDEPDECQKSGIIELETATGHRVEMHCLKRLLHNIETHQIHFDFAILNNDLSSGIPEVLKDMNIPIYPSIHAGWHSRLKSHHFEVANGLIEDLCELIGGQVDPWLLSSQFDVVDDIDINVESDRLRLMASAKTLFASIQAKYTQYGIDHTPFLVLKSDSGTYGMGVQMVECPEDIMTLNRKARNKLSVGKSAKVIDRFIIQEGVPTVNKVAGDVSELVLYQVANHPIGGFNRVHSGKNERQSLNSKGMTFVPLTTESDQIAPFIYQVLARLAGVAVQRETVALTSGIQP